LIVRCIDLARIDTISQYSDRGVEQLTGHWRKFDRFQVVGFALE
jgi:hypothetical protein